MKKIDKESSPVWFELWKQNFRNANGRNAHYKNDFSTDDANGSCRRRRLRKKLIEEQGAICCYCMQRIVTEDSHIEHFWPKEHFAEKDMDYNNLFTSCNGDGLISMDDYCGHRKNSWWNINMIQPTDPEVEKMFKYSKNGKIHPAARRSTSNIAQEMITNLGLDSFHLERSRREAIQASEVFSEEEYSEDELRELIDFYMNKDNGQYVPYCKAIADCLTDML